MGWLIISLINWHFCSVLISWFTLLWKCDFIFYVKDKHEKYWRSAGASCWKMMIIMFGLHSGYRTWGQHALRFFGCYQHKTWVEPIKISEMPFFNEPFVLRWPSIILSFLVHTQRLWKAFISARITGIYQPSTEVRTSKSPECLRYMTYLYHSPQ